MKHPLRSILLFLVCFSVMLSGCMGLFQQKLAGEYGSVLGQVVDSTGDGVPNVHVKIVGTGIAGVTDDQGHFSFPHVPAGTQQIVVESSLQVSPLQPLGTSDATLRFGGENQPALLLDNIEIPWEALFAAPEYAATADVVVKANQTVRVTLHIPLHEGLDSTTLVNATPKIGQTLQADAPPNFTFDVAYSLQSAQNGQVVLLLIAEQPDGQAKVLQEFSSPVKRGAGNVRLSGGLPGEIGAPNVRLMIALLDQATNVLAMNVPGGYPAEGGSTPFAPTLERAEIERGKVTLFWSGGNPVDFDRYDLYRRLSGESRQLVATTSDPNASFLVDDDPIGGATVYYELRMRTRAHRLFASNILPVDVPPMGIENIFATAAIGDIILDPVRDILYVSDVERNEIVLVSTNTDTVLERIQVGSRPMRMAITADGSTLFVTNSGGESITVVDLMTNSVSYIDGVRDPSNIAVDLNRDRLFYTSGFEDVTLKAISLSTGTLIAEVEIGGRYNIILYPDGSRLLVTPTVVSRDSLLFDTETLAEITQAHLGLLKYNTAHFLRSRGLIYVGQRVVVASDLSVLGNIDYRIDQAGGDFKILAVSPDEQYLFGSHQIWDGPPFFYILETVDDLWSATHRIRLRDYGDILKTVVTQDGLKVYIAAYNFSQKDSMSLIAIDLELRGIFTPLLEGGHHHGP